MPKTDGTFMSLKSRKPSAPAMQRRAGRGRGRGRGGPGGWGVGGGTGGAGGAEGLCAPL